MNAGEETRIDASLSVREHELFVEEVSARDLADRFGTPLYVISEDQLRRNARAYIAAFSERWPGEFLLLPSLKANPSLALRAILNEEGTGCDLFGPGELEVALATNADPGPNLAQRPHEGRGAARAGHPCGHQDHPRQRRRARAGSPGR